MFDWFFFLNETKLHKLREYENVSGDLAEYWSRFLLICHILG